MAQWCGQATALDADRRRIAFNDIGAELATLVNSGRRFTAKARETLGNGNRNRDALQFANYLADLRTAFGRVAVILKIFTANGSCCCASLS